MEDQVSNRKIYRIKLTSEERSAFKEIIKGKRGRMKIARWKVQRANAMLMCDESETGPAWLTRQCLSDRVESQKAVERRTTDWESDRNTRQKGIDWQFTTDTARIEKTVPEN